MNCKEEFTVVPNKQADRAIKALEVYCIHKLNRCRWKGALSELDQHLTSCQFVMIKCTLCDLKVPKQSIDSHMKDQCNCRPVSCQYCLTSGEYYYITGEHQELCLNELIPCPNNCEVEGVPRRDRESHKDVCSLTKVECPFNSIGCVELVTRKDMEQHNKEKLRDHLFLTNNELFKLHNEIEVGVNSTEKITTEKLDYIEAELNVAQKQLDGLFGIWNVRINAMAATKISGEVAPVILKLTNFSKSGSTIIRRRLTERACYSNGFFTHETGYKMFLKFTTSHVSVVRQTCYSVTLHLLKGPNDDQLSWPLKGKFEIVLLNQISDCAHRNTVVIYDSNTPVSKASRVTGNVLTSLRSSEGWGNSEFINHHDLHNTSSTCQFLKNDCLFFQVCKLE